MSAKEADSLFVTVMSPNFNLFTIRFIQAIMFKALFQSDDLDNLSRKFSFWVSIVFRTLTLGSLMINSGHLWIMMSSRSHKNFGLVNQFDFIKFCYCETPRCVIGRILVCLDVKPLSWICTVCNFLDMVGNKNMESSGVIFFFIYPRMTRESVQKNSWSSFKLSSSHRKLLIAAETVAATSSRHGTVTTFVSATLALSITSVQCIFLSATMHM